MLLICAFNKRYAYAIASALHGVQHILRKDFMIQVCCFSVLRYYPSIWNYFIDNV